MPLLLFLFLVVSLGGYIRWAQQRLIMDTPNHRSSHVLPTVRGGGIVLPIAWGLFVLFNGAEQALFSIGLLIVAGISFWDDIRPLGSTVRFLAQILAFSLMFWELGLFISLPWYALMLVLVFAIGLINLVNFMDGINGITGGYGLVFFAFSALFSAQPWSWGLENPTLYLVLALLAFGFYNFRTKARCFAGDIGSTTLGFIVIYYLLDLLQLPEAHGQFREVRWEYIFMVTVYGIDGILTIFQRLLQGENILQAHRKHLYQLLCNEYRWPHLLVAALYALLQAGINCLIWANPGNALPPLLLTLALGALYIPLKYYLIQRQSRPTLGASAASS